MRPDTSKLPMRWLIAGGIAAVAMALLLIRPLTHQPHEIAGPAPIHDDKKGYDGGNGPDDTPKDQLSLEQSTSNGQTIPWAGVSPSSSVRLEVVATNPANYDGTKISLSRNGGSYKELEADGLTAAARNLEAGRYRWRAVLNYKGSSHSDPLVPPRAAATSPDFIIPPPKLELANLQQTQLDSSPIGADLRANSGAILTATINYPAAVFEVELKPAGVGFDGRVAQSARTNDGGNAQIPFTGSDGPYQWRARARSPGGAVTPWREFRRTPRVDFIVFHQQPESNDSKSDENGNGSASNSMSGGLDQGGPRPSIVEPAPTLWSMLISRTWVISAGIIVAISAIWTLIRGITGRRKRTSR